MTLRNVEFDFKATRGQDYKRYSQGLKKVRAAMSALDADDEDFLLKANEVMDDFFCDLLGEDYDQRLGIDADDFDDLYALLDDFNAAAIPEGMQKRLAAMRAAPAELEDVQSSIPPKVFLNRAQRRAARRAKA